MQNLNVCVKHYNPETQENLFISEGHLYFQHISLLTDTISEYTLVPIDVPSFIKTTRQAQFPDNNYVTDFSETYGVETLATGYVIDVGTPQSTQAKPDQEAYVFLWPQKNGSVGLQITLEFVDFKQILDPKTQNEVLELLKQNVGTVDQSVV